MTAATLRMANIVAALLFLLGAGAAHAQTVIFDPNDSTKAIGIDDVETTDSFGKTTTHDIFFTGLVTANTAYGDFANPVFDFGRDRAALVADQINPALRDAGSPTVGAEGEEGQFEYHIGWDTIVVGPAENLWSWQSCHPALMPEQFPCSAFPDWQKFEDADSFSYNDTMMVFAKVVPEPDATLLIATALSTLGVVARWRREEGEGTA